MTVQAEFPGAVIELYVTSFRQSYGKGLHGGMCITALSTVQDKDVGYRFARIGQSFAEMSDSSAVTRVRPYTDAVATRKRSAGSG